MHVGTPAYFTGLLDTISDAENGGAAVHTEFIRSQPIPPDVIEEERRVLEAMKSGGPCEDRAIATLGWVHQREAFGDIPPSWQEHDLDPLQIIRLAGPTVIGAQIARHQRRFAWATDDWQTRRPRAAALFALQAAIGLRIGASRGTKKIPYTPGDEILIDARDRAALQGIDSTDRDVVMIWGAVHVRGIDTGLHARGFTHTADPEWRTVAVLPTISTALWHLFRHRAH
ncbi:hypothetical protein ACIBO1_07545 [Micromonospora sp. NPDC049903]|uniref:hypothetical protein n=1 Tax=Micromonospora sp. NPDC049903 TaxID=3364276 RepID=UPI0037B8B01A